MSNGQLYRVKKVYKMVKVFEGMNWIEQQSFLMAINKTPDGISRIKQPPDKDWNKKYSIRETKNKSEV